MFMRSIPILASTAALLLTTGPAGAAPVRLAPSSGWELLEYDDKCRMVRNFGSGNNETTLWIDKGGPGPGVNLTVIGRPVRNPKGAYVRIAFAPGQPVERNFITATTTRGRPMLGLFGVQPVALAAETGGEPERGADNGEESVDLTLAEAAGDSSVAALQNRFAAITALELSGAVFEPITLELDAMLPMASDLIECVNKLAKQLGRKPSEMGGLAKEATTVDVESWAQKIQENYPVHLLQNGQQASVAVRLTVNKEGRASFCEVTDYSGPASFNETACLQLLRHARFDPAKDAEGAPVASFYATRITYRINK